jgi:hypothetical protein
LEKPLEKKIKTMNELVKKLNQPELKEKRNPKTMRALFNKVLLPLKKEMEIVLAEAISQFKSTEISIGMDNQGHESEQKAIAYLKANKTFNEFRLEVRLNGFKLAGAKAFNIWQQIYFDNTDYNYSLSFDKYKQDLVPERLYSDLLNMAEIREIAEKFAEAVIDNINRQLEGITAKNKG